MILDSDLLFLDHPVKGDKATNSDGSPRWLCLMWDRLSPTSKLLGLCDLLYDSYILQHRKMIHKYKVAQKL